MDTTHIRVSLQCGTIDISGKVTIYIVRLDVYAIKKWSSNSHIRISVKLVLLSRSQCVQTSYMTRTCIFKTTYGTKKKNSLMYDLDSKISLLTFLYGWKKCVRRGGPIKGGNNQVLEWRLG